MSKFTVKQRKLAKLGYCYSKTQYSNGLRAIVRDLTQKHYDDVMFDHNAYNAHHGQA